MRVARSVNGTAIRVTDERWLHITEEHAELAGYLFDVIETVETPKAVVEGAPASCWHIAKSRLANAWWWFTKRRLPTMDSSSQPF